MPLYQFRTLQYNRSCIPQVFTVWGLYLCRCTYWVPHWVHSWDKNWQRRVSEVLVSTLCSSAMDSQTPQPSNRQNQPKCELSSFTLSLPKLHVTLPFSTCVSNALILTLLVPALFYLTPCSYIHRYWAMPAFWLKRQILLNLPCENLEYNVANSVDFMVERVSR